MLQQLHGSLVCSQASHMAGLINRCYYLMQFDITVHSASLSTVFLVLILSSPGAILCGAGLCGVHGCGELCSRQGRHPWTYVCRGDNPRSVCHTALLCAAATVSMGNAGQWVVYIYHWIACQTVCLQAAAVVCELGSCQHSYQGSCS